MVRSLRFRARHGRVKSTATSDPLGEASRRFADLLIELSLAEAEFMLVGGWAVILYGHVRATDDMDQWRVF